MKYNFRVNTCLWTIVAVCIKKKKILSDVKAIPIQNNIKTHVV